MLESASDGMKSALIVWSETQQSSPINLGVIYRPVKVRGAKMMDSRRSKSDPGSLANTQYRDTIDTNSLSVLHAKTESSTWRVVA